MKKLIVQLVLVVCMPMALDAQALNSADFLRAITSKAYKSKEIASIHPLSDGKSYAQLTEDGQRILAYSYKKGDVVDTLFDVACVKDCPVEKIEGFELDSAEMRVLLYTNSEKIYRRSFVADYYIYNRKWKKLDALSVEGKQRAAVFSPNGHLVAFARGNNIYVKKLDYNTEIAVTTDGEKNKIINGTPDWVYEEEFCNTSYIAWSPDSKLLAYVRLDERDVPTAAFQWYGLDKAGNNSYFSTETYKYPRAGESIAKASVKVYDMFYKTTKEMDLCNDGKDFYIPCLKWGKTPDVLFVFKLNRNQNVLDMVVCNPRSTVGKVSISERSNTYVDYNDLHAFEAHADGSCVWMSEADGYRHLYLYDWKTGKKIQQITKGEWDVTACYGYNEMKKVIYYQSAEKSPLERQVYAVDLKGKKICLTPRNGTNAAQFNADYTYFVNSYSAVGQPIKYSVCSGSNGVEVRVMEENAELKKKLDELQLPQKEFFTLKNGAGDVLNAWMVKPMDFDVNKKYPVLMVQYSGPNSQEVRNRYTMDWEYYLAANGYIVACVDGRGTGARGTKWRGCVYQNLGALEVEDQVAGANYLASLPYVDESRIGIWGWSYGGYITLACMVNGGGVFKAGIAVAPVTDWKLYDSAYTERFMRRPQENFKGYEKSSLLERAEALKGNLLIIHGTADDNVHVQNTMLFTEAMIKAGVQFDMMLYPDKNHSILGDDTRYHLYTKMARFLFEKL